MAPKRTVSASNTMNRKEIRMKYMHHKVKGWVVPVPACIALAAGFAEKPTGYLTARLKILH